VKEDKRQPGVGVLLRDSDKVQVLVLDVHERRLVHGHDGAAHRVVLILNDERQEFVDAAGLKVAAVVAGNKDLDDDEWKEGSVLEEEEEERKKKRKKKGCVDNLNWRVLYEGGRNSRSKE
jgi:hypothetical protein